MGLDLWTGREQFRRVADAHLADGAPVGPALMLHFARSLTNASHYAMRSPLWCEQRTTAAFADAATTALTLIDTLPGVFVRDGFASLSVRLRARQRQTVATAPKIILYSDLRSPRHSDGSAPSVSEHALVLELTITATTWERYRGTLPLVRDRSGCTHLSIWGQAGDAGSALNQGEWDEILIIPAAPEEDGGVTVELPPLGVHEE